MMKTYKIKIVTFRGRLGWFLRKHFSCFTSWAYLKFAVFSCVASAIVGCLLMWFVYCLPIDIIRANTKASIKDMFVKPSMLEYTFASKQLDVFTDLLILSEASLKLSDSTFNESLKNKRPNLGVHPYYDLLFSLDNNKVLSDNEKTTYAKYWFGCLVLLKPLLMFTDLHGIRVGNYVLQTGLLLLALVLLYKRFNILYSLAFFITILFINPIATGWCLQYSGVYYVLMCSVIYWLCKPDSDELKVFLFTGIATSFFDLLTYPIVTLGIPLIVLLIMRQENNKNQLKLIWNCCIGWFLGYIGMWICKWLIVTAFTPLNTLVDGFSSVLYRLFGDGTKEIGMNIDFSSINAIQKNLFNFAGELFFIIICFWGMICYLLRNFVKNVPSCGLNGKYFLLVGSLPFIWYSVVVNHSIIHAWMTCRILSITVFALLVYIIDFALSAKED